MTEQMNHSTAKQNRNKSRKQGKQIVRRLILIIVGLILGLNLYLANAGGILGNKLPMPFGYGLANVLSGSMEPTFSKGSLLLVKQTEEVQSGDIIVYQSKQELIVHRVIELDQQTGTVVTQGDANNVADDPFDQSQIKGKVIGWIPLLGNVAAILKKPLAVIVILILAFVLIEGSFRAQRDADDQKLDEIKAEIRKLKEEMQDDDNQERKEK